MRFEKLNENKIRITLNHDDLIKKNIDFHTFMSDSIESQELFLDMLEEAEKKIGFITKDYLLKIEAFAMTGGDFVLTVTRSLPKQNSNNLLIKNDFNKKLKSVHIKKKYKERIPLDLVYLFDSFDDYCSFVEYYKANFKVTNLAKKIILYEYNNNYYLALSQINPNFSTLKKLLSCITEFGSCVQNSDLFVKKLSERGNVIMKHNAISTSIKHFY